MILGIRHFQHSKGTGINIFLLKTWTLPIEELGSQCFHAFDSAFSKLETDDDATMVTSVRADERNVALRQLETASRNALAVLPLRFRSHAALWTIEQRPGHLYLNLPAWAKVVLENNQGSLFEIHNHCNSTWKTIKLSQNEIFAHLLLFGVLERIPLPQAKAPRFIRLSSAIESLQFFQPESASLRLSSESRESA